MSGKVRPLVAVDSEKQREIPPDGTTVGRCIWVIDLGTQHIEKFDKSVRRVLLGFELPDCLMESGEPFMVSKRYTLSLHKKALLRKDLESWRGKAFTEEELKKGFELSKLINQLCYLNIVHNEKDGKTYANIAGIIALPKDIKKAMAESVAHNPTVYFDFATFNQDVFAKLPQWLQEIIEQAEEYNNWMEEPFQDAIDDEEQEF